MELAGWAVPFEHGLFNPVVLDDVLVLVMVSLLKPIFCQPAWPHTVGLDDIGGSDMTWSCHWETHDVSRNRSLSTDKNLP